MAKKNKFVNRANNKLISINSVGDKIFIVSEIIVSKSAIIDST